MGALLAVAALLAVLGREPKKDRNEPVSRDLGVRDPNLRSPGFLAGNLPMNQPQFQRPLIRAIGPRLPSLEGGGSALSFQVAPPSPRTVDSAGSAAFALARRQASRGVRAVQAGAIAGATTAGTAFCGPACGAIAGKVTKEVSLLARRKLSDPATRVARRNFRRAGSFLKRKLF